MSIELLQNGNKIKSFIFNVQKVRSFVLSNEKGEAIIIDPGNSNDEENQEIASYIDSNGLTPIAILFTHGHIDHMIGSGWLKERYGVESWVDRGDYSLLKEEVADALLKFFSYDTASGDLVVENYYCRDEKHTFGSIEAEVIYSSGHTEGSVLLYFPAFNALFVGDNFDKKRIWFLNSSYVEFIEMLKRTVLTFPLETTLYSGHSDSWLLKETILPSSVRHLLEG